MYVLPSVRGQGVAADLLDALERTAVELGFGTARLDTGPSQLDAERLDSDGLPGHTRLQQQPPRLLLGRKGPHPGDWNAAMTSPNASSAPGVATSGKATIAVCTPAAPSSR